ncbi:MULTISPECIES: hypothetical protein [Halorussus]|uniref:hypothetical protein n=1 Tax=Halorussus TaxID=1070314 RepID=UPI000E2153DC|nr:MULTISPECIES: hypothetical protein [Halorussus]NHN61420.1 hypothetical protein [Halorussus sp. JP-T4]
MADRLLPSADGVLFAVLWAGMAGFVVLHSVTLFESTGERAVSLIRLAWFLGLGVVVIAGAYAVVRGDLTGTDA